MTPASREKPRCQLHRHPPAFDTASPLQGRQCHDEACSLVDEGPRLFRRSIEDGHLGPLTRLDAMAAPMRPIPINPSCINSPLRFVG